MQVAELPFNCYACIVRSICLFSLDQERWNRSLSVSASGWGRGMDGETVEGRAGVEGADGSEKR